MAFRVGRQNTGDESSVADTTREITTQGNQAIKTAVLGARETLVEMEEKRRSRLLSLFDPMARVARQGRLRVAKGAWEFRVQVIEGLQKVHLQDFEDHCNRYLRESRAVDQKYLEGLLLRKQAELQTEISEAAKAFNQDYTERYKQAATLTPQRVQDLELDRLDEDMLRFHEACRRRRDSFINYIEQQLKF